jgi:hypothetical protein
MIETAAVKYVFLDIVGFTRGRTVEAQSELVVRLNLIVARAIAEVAADEKETIFLPTGDGMAIAFPEHTLAVAALVFVFIGGGFEFQPTII